MKLGIHTVFILRENILFLEEWIDYHLSIGFDCFFLYDNSNSAGNEGVPAGINRYRYNFLQITEHISEDQLHQQFTALLKKYGDIITTVQWEPKDNQGHIIYGQQRSIKDYITRYSGQCDWTAFIDMDEFIYSKTPVKEILGECELEGITDLRLLQKKFDDRFNNLGIPVTNIVDCIEGIDTWGWGPKHILKNDRFNLAETGYWNVHTLPTKNSVCAAADIDEIRFNHYNVNKFQLSWMKQFYGTDQDLELNAKCYELCNLVTTQKQFTNGERLSRY